MSRAPGGVTVSCGDSTAAVEGRGRPGRVAAARLIRRTPLLTLKLTGTGAESLEGQALCLPLSPFSTRIPKAPMNPMHLSNRAIAGMLGLFRNAFGVAVFMGCERMLLQLSGFAALLAAVMGLGFGVVGAIRTDSLVLLLMGAGWFVGVNLAYFVGTRMLTACAVTLKNTPSNISSSDYLEVLGLGCVVLLLALLGGSAYWAIKVGAMTPVWWALGGAVVAIWFAAMYLNPSLISTRVHPTASAGEDAVSLSVLVLKTFVRLAPMVFSILTVVGAGLLGWGLWRLVGAEGFELFQGGLASFSGFITVAAGLLYPLYAYLAFVLGYLVLDLARSILALPRLLQPQAAVPAEPSTVPVDEGPPLAPAQARAMKWVLGGALVLMALLVAGVEGKNWYEERQAQAEQARLEAEQQAAQRKAEAERVAAEQARARAEAERIAKLASELKSLAGKPSIDLVLLPAVSSQVAEILGRQQAAYERYFASSSPVEELDGWIVGKGCIADACGSQEGIVAVELATGKAHLAVYFDRSVRFLGQDTATTAPPVIRKWAMQFP